MLGDGGTARWTLNCFQCSRLVVLKLAGSVTAIHHVSKRSTQPPVLCWEAVVLWDTCQALHQHPVTIYLAGQAGGAC